MISWKEDLHFFTFCTMIAVSSTAKAMLMPLVPLYAVHLEASPRTVGLLISVSFWLPLLLAISVGNYIDKEGYATLLIFGTLLLAISPMIAVFTANLYYLAIAQVLIGLAQLVLVLSAQTLVSAFNINRGRQRMWYFGWYSSFQSFGQLIGPVLMGIVTDFYGFSHAFMLAGTISFIALILLLVIVKKLQINQKNKYAHVFTLKKYLKNTSVLLGNVGIQMAMVTSCGVIFAMTFQATFLPMYLESLSISATLIGVLFSLRAFASMIIRPLMSYVVDLHGNRSKTMLSMILIIVVSLCIIGLLDSLIAVAIAVVITGIGSGISQPLSLAVVADYSQQERRGFAIGLRLTGNRLAQVLSPVLFGLFVEALGFRVAFLIGAISLALVATYTWLLVPTFENMERTLVKV